MGGSTVRYMDWRGSLKQGSLDRTPSFRHCIYDILQNNVLCKTDETLARPAIWI